jgi:4-amino-4-deoxy-L-arabinose transferase-like glycosyltransferase
VAGLRRSRSEGAARWGGPGTALIALLGLAAGLRVVGIAYGLPFALLNPDEQSIVPLAWRMARTHSPNPHGFFDYPTLVPELLAPFQAWQGSPSYLAGRIVVVVLGLGAVAAAWWLGRRAYGSVAGAVAAAVVAVDATAVAYSRMAVTDVPLALGITVSLALMIEGPLELAGLAAGLATGAKYPGVFLLVPLVLVGWRTRWPLARSLALVAVGFLATSPFVLVHPGEAWSDVARVQRLAHAGWLGFEHDNATPIAFLDRLWEGLGPALIIAVVGLGYALVKRTRADVVLSSFVVVYFLDLLTVRAHFDRYTLPLVAPLGALAGRLRALAPVTLILLLVPFVWDVRADHRLTRTDTRVVAQRWIEAHVPAGSSIAAESSTPPLPGLRVLGLKLPGPGRPSDPNRDVPRLRARGVRYVLVTGAIADRVLAARSRYPLETRFYAQLGRTQRLYRLDPGHRYAGPWVALYRLYP